MKTETQELTGRDLKDQADKWVNSSFNMIQMNVYEKMCDNMLFEFIRQDDPDFGEFLNNYNLWDEYNEYLKESDLEDIEDNRDEFCRDHSSFDQFQDEQRDANYPMWNTLFEFKEEPSEEVIQSAIDSGFGVIEGMDDFNTTLFVTGCGYSFYGAHWIPLFLELPWNEELKAQAKGVEYGNQ